ncbi:MAG: preprotein translocase subunit YajC [Rickettsiaceae bacterium]|nr:preprotein translocase subunit YajC [Rickettsiaceae bacterium]
MTIETTLVPDQDYQQEAQANMFDSIWTSIIPLILSLFVLYFLVIRPQEQKRKKQEDLIGSAKKGEDVITSSGIYGKIAKVSESDPFLMLEIAENVKVKILKSSIVEITSRKSPNS